MYVTLLQLAERPGATELAQVASASYQAVVDAELMDATLRAADRSAYSDDDIAAADAAAARITEAVLSADSLINGFLARRSYPLPLDPVPELVSGWSRAIARYNLNKDRISDPKTDPVARDYSDALKFLQLTADGKFSLGIDDPQPTTALGPTVVQGEPRHFDECSLNDFVHPNGYVRRSF